MLFCFVYYLFIWVILIILYTKPSIYNTDGATTTQKNHLLHPGGLAFWMMIAAASAAAIAIGAMIIGSRRKSKSNYHPLKGSLDRRMKLFGPMADGCFEDRELCGAQTDVGDSANNMELSEGGSHYKEMV